MLNLNNKLRILLGVLLISFFVGCATDQDENYQNEQIAIIDFDPAIALQNVSLEQQELYHKARDIFGKYVSFDGEQFITSCDDAQKIGLSQRVYDHFEIVMNGTNKFLTENSFQEIAPGVLAPQIDYTAEYLKAVKETGRHAPQFCKPSPLKTRSENSGYWGSASYSLSRTQETYWWGYSTTTKFDQTGAQRYADRYCDYNSAVSTIAGSAGVVGAFTKTNPAAAAAVGALGTIAGANAWVIGSKINEAARKGGIKVVYTVNHYVPPGTPSWHYTVYDSEGKIVTSFLF